MDFLLGLFEAVNPDAKKFVSASRQGDLDRVKRILLKRNVNVNAFYCGATALMLASHSGMNDTVHFLLTHGVDPNIQSHMGKPALSYAVSARRLRTIQILIAHGAEVPHLEDEEYRLVAHATQQFKFRELPGALAFAHRQTHRQVGATRAGAAQGEQGEENQGEAREEGGEEGEEEVGGADAAGSPASQQTTRQAAEAPAEQRQQRQQGQQRQLRPGLPGRAKSSPNPVTVRALLRPRPRGPKGKRGKTDAIDGRAETEADAGAETGADAGAETGAEEGRDEQGPTDLSSSPSFPAMPPSSPTPPCGRCGYVRQTWQAANAPGETDYREVFRVHTGEAPPPPSPPLMTIKGNTSSSPSSPSSSSTLWKILTGMSGSNLNCASHSSSSSSNDNNHSSASRKSPSPLGIDRRAGQQQGGQGQVDSAPHHLRIQLPDSPSNAAAAAAGAAGGGGRVPTWAWHSILCLGYAFASPPDPHRPQPPRPGHARLGWRRPAAAGPGSQQHY